MRIPWHISSQLTSVGHFYEFNRDAVVRGSVSMVVAVTNGRWAPRERF